MIKGSSGLAIIKDGVGALTLTGANTYSGSTTVSGGGSLILSGANGAISGTSSVTVTYATLTLDNTSGSANTDRVPTQAVNLNGGKFNLYGGTETVGNVTIGVGQSKVYASSGSTLTIGNTFTATTVGGAVDFEGTGTIVGNPGITNGILSYRATYNGNTWATVSGGNIVAYDTANATPLPASGFSGTVNYILTGSQTMTAADGNANTLIIAPSASGQSLTQNAQHCLNVNSILFTGSQDFNINASGGGLWLVNAGPGCVLQNYGTGTLIFNTGFVDGGAYATFAGTGTTILRAGPYSGGNAGYNFVGGTIDVGAFNLVTGKPYLVAGATLNLSDTATSSTGTSINPGTLALNAGTITQSAATPGTLTLGGTLTAGSGVNSISSVYVALGGARTITVSDYQDVLNISSAINGGANALTKNGNGTLILSNGSNSGINATTVTAGKLTLANVSGSALGTGNLSISAGDAGHQRLGHDDGQHLTSSGTATLICPGDSTGRGQTDARRR